MCIWVNICTRFFSLCICIVDSGRCRRKRADNRLAFINYLLVIYSTNCYFSAANSWIVRLIWGRGASVFANFKFDVPFSHDDILPDRPGLPIFVLMYELVLVDQGLLPCAYGIAYAPSLQMSFLDFKHLLFKVMQILGVRHVSVFLFIVLLLDHRMDILPAIFLW